MARPLRILTAGGWYQVMSRGNWREAIYRTHTDRRRFLGWVAEWPERFGLEVHAFVRMDTHYHWVVRYGQQRLVDVVRWAGGMNDGAAAQVVRRFAAGLAKDTGKVRFLQNIRRRLGQDREEKHP
jgi:hypothetical protein